MHLTRDQHGAYLLLLMAYWMRGGPLPENDNELAAIVRASKSEWARLKIVLAPFFEVADEKWVQKRAEEELTRARGIVEAKSRAGKGGAAKRWQKDDTANGNSIADASVSHRQTDTPLPSNLVPVSEEAKASSGGAPAKLVLVADKPDWWPLRDRYGRVLGEVTDKLLFDVGKAVLGSSAGGQITKLKKYHPYRHDWRAAVELLLRADEASDPRSWFAAALHKASVDEPVMPMHEAYPYAEYRL